MNWHRESPVTLCFLGRNNFLDLFQKLSYSGPHSRQRDLFASNRGRTDPKSRGSSINGTKAYVKEFFLFIFNKLSSVFSGSRKENNSSFDEIGQSRCRESDIFMILLAFS